LPAKTGRRDAHRPQSLEGRAPLADIQRVMLDTIRQPLAPGERMRRDSAGAADAIIKPNDRLTSFERLQIYNQQYWWRLLANFADDFRGLRAVLGERKFDRVAVAYLEAFPSRSWTLRNLGSHLAEFLAAHPELTAPHSALALDVARVEWARTVAFDEAEMPPINPQRIAKAAPERLRLGVQPYVQLLELRYPVDQLLLRIKQHDVQAVSNAATAARRRRAVRLFAKPGREPIFLAVHRHDFLVYYKRLEPEAWRLLHALRAGRTLDDACVEAFADSSDSDERNTEKVREWFATWTAFGWLCRA
jgi:hypothetical protein